jgi:tRNA-dihydrouridine synthase
MMEETGCVSVMIGRAAIGRPWVFNAEFDGWPGERQREYQEQVITRHVELIRTFLPEGRFQQIQMKRHLSYYARGLSAARECRRTIFTECNTLDETWSTFRRFWDAG